MLFGWFFNNFVRSSTRASKAGSGIIIRFWNRRSAAWSSSEWNKRMKISSDLLCGIFVAAMRVTLSFGFEAIPSSWTKNSVLSRQMASSLSFRVESRESTSSTKIIAGWITAATANRARTVFSPSPTHFEVRLEAEMLKKWASGASLARARAIRVLPLPGGPYIKSPWRQVDMSDISLNVKAMSTVALGGDRRPTNISGRTAGRSTISRRALFAFSFPATSLNNP